MLDNLDRRPRRSGCASASALEDGDADDFGALMHEHWQRKRERSPGMSQRRRSTAGTSSAWTTAPSAASWSAPARGGFLLFYADDPRRAARRDGRRGAAPRCASPSTSTARPSSSAELTTCRCVVLAGGLGDPHAPAHRRPCRRRCCPVAGRPFADHQLALLAADGRRPTSCFCDRLPRRADPRRTSATAPRWGCAIRYVDEGDGPARHRRARCASPPTRARSTPRFAVLYGDSYLPIDLAAGLATPSPRAAPPALMTVLRNDGRWDAQQRAPRRDGRVALRQGRRRPGGRRHATTSTTGSPSSTATRSCSTGSRRRPVADLAELSTATRRRGPARRATRSTSASTRSARRAASPTSSACCRRTSPERSAPIMTDLDVAAAHRSRRRAARPRRRRRRARSCRSSSPRSNEELTIADFVAWCQRGAGRRPASRGEILIVDSSTRSHRRARARRGRPRAAGPQARPRPRLHRRAPVHPRARGC